MTIIATETFFVKAFPKFFRNSLESDPGVEVGFSSQFKIAPLTRLASGAIFKLNNKTDFNPDHIKSTQSFLRCRAT
jgi:hypothetical protein